MAGYLPNQQFYMVVLCQGQRANGDHYWAYLKMAPLKVKAFKKAQAKGRFNLEDYGEIIAWGLGEAVPEEVKTRMEDEHGVNHSFQDEAIEVIKKVNKKS